MSKRYHRETINRLIEEVRRWGWNEGNEGRDFRRPKAVSEAIAALTAALQEQASLPVEDGWKPTHRHVKRGSEYVVVGTAEVQCSAGDGLTEAELVIVYRGKNGDLWVRRMSEFNDGRFEALPSSPAQGGR